MPAWGMHLYTAKKINKKIKIKDYNSFLIGNIITDINNGYVVEDISKIIAHKKTHYYLEEKKNRDGKLIYYDVEQFIKDNKEKLDNPIVLGYITHLLTDEYWNSLTYDKHGIHNEKGKLIGVTLNTGIDLIIDGEKRREIKQNDFKIFVKYLYENNLIDIPMYNEKICEQMQNIKKIDLTKEDINKTIEYLNRIKNGINLSIKDYKIFTQKEMEDSVDICVNNIIEYFKIHNINL